MNIYIGMTNCKRNQQTEDIAVKFTTMEKGMSRGRRKNKS